ncbi:hypothetical protein, partial [Ornithobacterium rhinotracheale]
MFLVLNLKNAKFLRFQIVLEVYFLSAIIRNILKINLKLFRFFTFGTFKTQMQRLNNLKLKAYAKRRNQTFFGSTEVCTHYRKS